MFKFILILIVIIGTRLTEEAFQPVALVLARGGSKGIPLKNLAKINGQSLLSRTLHTIHKSSSFNSVWVSTDHHLIAKEASLSNASVFSRSEEFARDGTASIDSVKEFLSKRPEISRLALIQCTSPFIQPEYLREAVEKFMSQECVFAVRRSHEFRWQRDSNGKVAPLNLNPLKRPRRQDWEGEMVENGMFYLATRDLIMNAHSFQSTNCSVVEIPAEDSLQIDHPGDLLMAELILKNQRSSAVEENTSSDYPGESPHH